MPVHERLGSLSKDTREITSPCREESIESTGDLIQRCVIIQRDEKGYGLTVSGDNPVFVQSVKENGAAARAGVQQGDKIIKVNGTLVTNSNHREVVKLIKSGSYVALTLHGRPAGHKTPERITDRISGPQSVDAEIEREFENQKVTTTRLMLKQALDNYERVRKDYLHHPSEKLQVQLAEAQKTIEVIKKKLEVLTGPETPQSAAQLSSVSPGSSTTSQSPDYSSPTHVPEHGFMSPTTNNASSFQMVYAPKPWGGSPFHQKSPSMPETFYAGEDTHDAAAVVRSHSDVTRSSSSQLFTTYEPPQEEVKQHKVSATSLPSTMSTAEVQGTGSSFDSQSAQSDTNEELPESGSEPSLRMTDSNANDEGGKLQLVSPNQVNIISMEDDDFASEEEQALDDHGPFSELSVLKTKPAHLAVFIHYLISNSDPSALFFYLVSENYSTGSQKEMRKWAYEIYSTFLLKDAPLAVVVDECTLTEIEETLQNKYDKEETLRSLFQPARQQVLHEVNELLADFRNKRALGLGSFYGDQDLQDDNMDRSTELRHAEKCLAPDWEALVIEETDRSQAMASALSTFLRNLGITRIGSVSMVDRCSSFVTRDKRLFRLKSNKKIYSQKGHSFTANHYYSTVYCANCSKALWGIGNQGYQCLNCEINIHKNCLENFEEVCGKKNKKDRRSMLNFDRIRKPSSPNPAAIEKAKQLHAHSEKADDQEPVLSPKQPSVFHIQAPVTEVNEEEPAKEQSYSSRVTKLVDRYQGMNSNNEGSPESSPRSRSPETTQVSKKEVNLSRSESLNNERRLGTKVSRRAKSDVTVDEDTIKALSGDSNEHSSSASSLSNKSAESPSNSTEKLEQTSPPQPAFTSRFLNDSDLDVETEMPTLDKQLPKDILKKLKPKEKKRQEVINELFFTERTHLRNLKILDQLFYRPMMMDSFVSDSLVRTVFPNLDDVIKVHKSLNDAMKKRHKESPVVTHVADLLLSRFEGHAGEIFKKECATFIRNQSYALELLKQRQRKEPKLAQLLAEAESSPLCRRLQLKDLIPTEFHRLTKYPLLIDNLMKYTSVNTPEHASLSQATKLCKEILHHVNQALKECENQNKLVELQRKLDRRSLENPNNRLSEYKNLDLTTHKLLFNGDLTWRLNKNKLVDVHVALLEDLLVILQKQDDRYILKCQSTTVVADTKFTHSPIIKLTSIFLRINASDKRAFFLVSTSSLGPQIYDLVASSAELRKAWFRNITDAVADAAKSNGGRRNAQVVTQPVPFNIEQEKNVDDEEKEKNENVEFENAEEVVMIEETGIIQPKEVVVSNPAYTTTQAQQSSSDIDFIKKKDTEIKALLDEKQSLVAKVLNIPVEHFGTIAEVAGEVEGEKEPKELVLASIYQLNRLTALVNDSIHLPNQEEGPAKGSTSRVPADKLLPITNSLSDYLSQLLGLLSMKDTENVTSSLQAAPSPGRPSSYISVGDSSASEAEGAGMIDETDNVGKRVEDSDSALLFGFAPEPPPEQTLPSRAEDEEVELAVREDKDVLPVASIGHVHTVDEGIALPAVVDDHELLSITEPLDAISEAQSVHETHVEERLEERAQENKSVSPLNILEAVPHMAEAHDSEPVQFETLDSDSELSYKSPVNLCVVESVESHSDQEKVDTDSAAEQDGYLSANDALGIPSVGENVLGSDEELGACEVVMPAVGDAAELVSADAATAEEQSGEGLTESMQDLADDVKDSLQIVEDDATNAGGTNVVDSTAEADSATEAHSTTEEDGTTRAENTTETHSTSVVSSTAEGDDTMQGGSTAGEDITTQGGSTEGVDSTTEAGSTAEGGCTIEGGQPTEDDNVKQSECDQDTHNDNAGVESSSSDEEFADTSDTVVGASF